MKNFLLALLLAGLPCTLSAHDHIEIGLASGTQRLVFSGDASQLATYFPIGETPSTYLANFPGGTFARELSFSAFDHSAPPPAGAFVCVEVLAVTGPPGSILSFWEAGASAPIWSRPAGWVATAGDRPSISVSESGNGYGHIHGRAFTTSEAGHYELKIRAIDITGPHQPSEDFVIVFNALQTPQLAISLVSSDVSLSFISREGLSYDVQTSTSLAVDDWHIIGEPLDGTGSSLQFTDPIAARSRVFYRLVEYQ